MARPIEPTPVLSAEQFARFVENVDRMQDVPLRRVELPDLDAAVQKAHELGLFRK